ncbi:MAG TPA: hybrid sensor histidine kinase/response regulator [Candidatus Binatia bacterium]|nr:hybrid sensor histidine kinase/response regulator [Candidatus Binatia bacterium]
MSPPEQLSEQDFQRLFAAEAEGRLDTLVDQLLTLEKSGPSPELLASLFREAHTVKGGAAVVGMAQVARVAHALEDLLEEVRRERRGVDASLIDAVLGGIDSIRTLIPLALAGEDHEAQASEAEQRLRGGLQPRGTAAEAAGQPAPPASPSASAASSGTPVSGHDAISRSEAAQPSAASASAPAPPTTSPRGPAVGPAPAAPSAAAPSAAAPERPAPSEPAVIHPGEGGHWSGSEMVQMPVHRVDELVRLIGEASAATLRLGSALLEQLERDPSTVSEYRDLVRSLNELQELALRARMVPVMSLAPRLRRAVRDLARETGKQVRFETRGEDAEIDRGVLDRLADPLLHLVRNAVDHGIEPPEERRTLGKPPEGMVRLHAMQLGSEVIIAVSDDGRGIDVARVREAAGRSDSTAMDMDDESALYLIFRSGLSTATRVTGLSGRGVGLDAVRASLNAVRGRIEVRSDRGQGTEFRIAVPITMATLRCLVVNASGQTYAIPLHSVRAVLMPQPSTTVSGRAMTMFDGRPVPISSLASVLGTGDGCSGPAVVIAGLTRTHALAVDHLVDQRDVVVKGLGELVPRLPAVAGAGVEPDGSILLVLEAAGLIERARRGEMGTHYPSADSVGGVAVEPAGTPHSSLILVVDDALTVRELQRSIFEHAGYRVQVAANGDEALVRMAEERPDLVLTDIQMPVMDGFVLTEKIRSQPALSSVPVIILTSRASDEDRKRGLEAGADGYIVKSGFDQAALLSAVERLLGAPA